MQFLIIYGWLEDRMIRAAFVLMKKRRSKDYNKALMAIKSEALKHNLELRPEVSTRIHRLLINL